MDADAPQTPTPTDAPDTSAPSSGAPSPAARPRRIAMMNQKGGVGKTTTAVNLGAALAQAGNRVCLIDLDPQAHLTLHVGLDPNNLDHSVYDLLTEPDLSALAVMHRVDDELAVVPAETDLAAAETELAGRADRQLILRNKLSGALANFDYVLIDCPPSLGLLTLNALALAREVIVPMQAHFLALQGLSKLLETVRLVRQSVNPELTVAGVVLCMHEAQTNLAREVVGDLERFFAEARRTDQPWAEARVYHPPIRRNVKLAECPSFGQTIFQYEPWCAGGRDYLALASAVAGAGTDAEALQ